MTAIFFPAIIIFITILYIYQYYQKCHKPLPGPWNLPLIGSLYLLNPKTPFHSLLNLTKKYGGIFYLNLGMMKTVIVTDTKLLKKILAKDESKGRPPLYLLNCFFRPNKGIVYATGNVWKDQRKFVTNFLKASGATKMSVNRKNLENHIMENVNKFVHNIKNQGNHVTLNPAEAISYYVNCISGTLFLGKPWSSDETVWKTLFTHLDQFAKLVAYGGAVNFLPFLRYLPKYKNIINIVREHHDAIHRIQNEIIAENQKSFQKDHIDSSNFIHSFLFEKSKNRSDDTIYNMEQLRYLLVDMFAASVETTVNTMMWVILYLAEYQEVQDKVRQELFEVLQNKIPETNDLQNLPFMKATLAEVGRIRTVAPLGFPHYSTGDILIDNIKIDKGTMILGFLWGIHMNSEVWKSPEEFKPERFLNSDGRYHQPESFIPFLTGKRVCVGDELSKMMVFLFFATLLQNFQIKNKHNGLVDLEAMYGLALTPKPQEILFSQL